MVHSCVSNLLYAHNGPQVAFDPNLEKSRSIHRRINNVNGGPRVTSVLLTSYFTLSNCAISGWACFQAMA